MCSLVQKVCQFSFVVTEILCPILRDFCILVWCTLYGFVTNFVSRSYAASPVNQHLLFQLIIFLNSKVYLKLWTSSARQTVVFVVLHCISCLLLPFIVFYCIGHMPCAGNLIYALKCHSFDVVVNVYV